MQVELGRDVGRDVVLGKTAGMNKDGKWVPSLDTSSL
jgi:hypothetical protein